MAKPKTEKTAIQLAADHARAEYSKAKDANEKSDNATTQKALAAAETARNTAVLAERRERFVRVGAARVSKAVTSLVNVGKLAEPRSYQYEESDIVKAETAINNAASAAIAALRAAKQKGGAKATVAGFSFE